MHFDPRLMTIFGVLFVALGIFNLVVGRNRMRQAQGSSSALPWYRQMAILTGIEYILLGLVLLLLQGINSGFFPHSLAVLATPLYTIVLLLAAFVLVAMLVQALRASRQRRQPLSPNSTTTVEADTGEQASRDLSPEQRAEAAQRKRGRRQKAAAARRRQSGQA